MGQPWIFNERLRLAVGAGPYVAIDTYRVAGGTNTEDKVSALVTMTASYQFARHWIVRGSWNRVLTGYNKDSDVFSPASATVSKHAAAPGTMLRSTFLHKPLPRSQNL